MTPAAGRGVSGGRLLLAGGLGLAATAATLVVCSLFGDISLWDAAGTGGNWWPVWWGRVTVLAGAALVGGSLAASGAGLQGLLRNPLAEPFVLGISSGAGFGVLAGRIASGGLGLDTPMLALIGALATCAAVYFIAQRSGQLDPLVLLLSGVIVNVFIGAASMGLLLLAEPNDMLAFLHWSMGHVSMLNTLNGRLMALCATFGAVGWGVLLLRSAALNALGLGDEVATASGVSVARLRLEVFVAVGLMTSGAVCLAGPIGFIGLIVPHVCRLMLGPDHRRLVVVGVFVGAIFLMVAETLCRTALPALAAATVRDVGVIPVGVVTALTGGPFFLYLLRTRSRGGGLG